MDVDAAASPQLESQAAAAAPGLEAHSEPSTSSAAPVLLSDTAPSLDKVPDDVLLQVGRSEEVSFDVLLTSLRAPRS